MYCSVDMAIQIQIMDKVIYISHSTNTYEKGINPTILPSALGKY